MNCFQAACLLKAVICWAFGVVGIFFPMLVIQFFFDSPEMPDPHDLFMTKWFGKYILDFGTCIFLLFLFVKDEKNQRRASLGLALTQLIGLIFTCTFVPNLDLAPLKYRRWTVYVIPVGYFFLIMMFVGVSYCKCSKCKTKKCCEGEKEKEK